MHVWIMNMYFSHNNLGYLNAILNYKEKIFSRLRQFFLLKNS